MAGVTARRRYPPAGQFVHCQMTRGVVGVEVRRIRERKQRHKGTFSAVGRWGAWGGVALQVATMCGERAASSRDRGAVLSSQLSGGVVRGDGVGR